MHFPTKYTQFYREKKKKIQVNKEREGVLEKKNNDKIIIIG